MLRDLPRQSATSVRGRGRRDSSVMMMSDDVITAFGHGFLHQQK